MWRDTVFSSLSGLGDLGENLSLLDPYCFADKKQVKLDPWDWRLSVCFEAVQSQKNLPLEVKAILQMACVHEGSNHGRPSVMGPDSQIIDENRALFLKKDRTALFIPPLVE